VPDARRRRVTLLYGLAFCNSVQVPAQGDMQYFCFFILAGCVGGAGVGTLFRRPTSGAIVGFLLAVLGIIVLVAILARNAG
jgi:hypothetical protein